MKNKKDVDLLKDELEFLKKRKTELANLCRLAELNDIRAHISLLRNKIDAVTDSGSNAVAGLAAD